MGEETECLPAFPSSSDAFKDFQRHSQPPCIPRYKPEIAQRMAEDTHVISCNSDLLAHPPGGRRCVTRGKKKKSGGGKRAERVSSEGEEGRGVVGDGDGGSGRQRSTRRRTVREFKDFVRADDGDAMECSDDDDFM